MATKRFHQNYLNDGTSLFEIQPCLMFTSAIRDSKLRGICWFLGKATSLS
jgi:hypothetical protein